MSEDKEDAKPVPPTKPLTLWVPGYKLTQEELEAYNRLIAETMICPNCGNRLGFQEDVMGRRLMRCAVCGLRLFEPRSSLTEEP